MANILKGVQVGIPAAILGSGGFYLMKKRNDYLEDPVLKRGLKHLMRDQRVADFCGDKITPGWMVTREKRPGENWVKYELTVKGASGKLKTVLIADYLTHMDLSELEQERGDYFKKQEKLTE